MLVLSVALGSFWGSSSISEPQIAMCCQANGLLFKHRSPKALEEQMRRCLLDPAWAKSLANSGYLRLGLYKWNKWLCAIVPNKEVQTSVQICPNYIYIYVYIYIKN